MKSGVYRIRCLKTDQSYWGSSNKIERRFIEHKSILTRGIHANKKLQSLFNEYGLDNFSFEIYEECGISDLGKREKFYLDSDKNKLNIWIEPFSPKGCKRQYQVLHSDATKKKIRNSILKRYEIFGCKRIGLKHTEETKRKISNAKKGFRHSEESKLKMKGRKSSFLGRKHSLESLKKLSESAKGKIGFNKGFVKEFPPEKKCIACEEIKPINKFEFTGKWHRNKCGKCRELLRKPRQKRK